MKTSLVGGVVPQILSSFCAMMMGPIVFVCRCKAKSPNDLYVKASTRNQECAFGNHMGPYISVALCRWGQPVPCDRGNSLTFGYFRIPAFRTMFSMRTPLSTSLFIELTNA